METRLKAIVAALTIGAITLFGGAVVVQQTTGVPLTEQSFAFQTNFYIGAIAIQIAVGALHSNYLADKEIQRRRLER